MPDDVPDAVARVHRAARAGSDLTLDAGEVIEVAAVLNRLADPEQTPPVAAGEDRVTAGLMLDVFAVLERHGYRAASPGRPKADSMVALLRLVRVYEADAT